MYVYSENISIKIINSNYQTVIEKSRNSIKHRIINILSKQQTVECLDIIPNYKRIKESMNLEKKKNGYFKKKKNSEKPTGTKHYKKEVRLVLLLHLYVHFEYH
jgi:hypothetical protein